MKLIYWESSHGIKNFGDELNPWLWGRILPGFFDEDDRTVFLGIGTLLGDIGRRLAPRARTRLVFGSGAGYGEAPRIDNTWKIYCVRGPLTAKALGLPERFGVTDPAILVNQFYTVRSEKVHKYAFMPHCKNASAAWEVVCRKIGFKYIDPCLPVETILESIGQAQILLTEALHGAIVADALGTPWIGVRTTPAILSFKWEDWCQSVGLDYKPETIWPVWPMITSGLTHKTYKVVKQKVKQACVAHQLWRIATRSRPLLSRRERIGELTGELLLRMKQLEDDVAAGNLLQGSELDARKNNYTRLKPQPS